MNKTSGSGDRNSKYCPRQALDGWDVERKEGAIISPPSSLLPKKFYSSNPSNLEIKTVTNDFKRIPRLQLQPCSTLSGQDSTLPTQRSTTALPSELQGKGNNNNSLQRKLLFPEICPPVF